MWSIHRPEQFFLKDSVVPNATAPELSVVKSLAVIAATQEDIAMIVDGDIFK